ncbi:unnamed protein product [Menidia menidia]|uniref:(Atlantic silverside) hypothetical protein n=1 Tax=Menidia menidia TaxID=238744 RepID=A0A8S4AZC8_9TELE|nr:unnamed protein product [Menidia menidia]
MEEQRAEIEKERKLKAEQLKEMEENINRERDQRKKEQETREQEEKKRKEEEEQQKQKWEQEREDLEKKIRSESKEKKEIDRKLEQSRKEMKAKREDWERERKELWEKKYKEDEERSREEELRLKKLEEKLEQEKEKYDKKNKEDQMRREQEEKERADLEERFNKEIKEMEDMKTKYESEARIKAEEFNEFKDKYQKEVEALMEKHNKKLKDLTDKHEELNTLKMEQEEELQKLKAKWSLKLSVFNVSRMAGLQELQFLVLLSSVSELRLVLLGNSWAQSRDVGNLILGEKVFSTEDPDCCVRVSGRCKWKEVALISTPDLLHPNLPEDKVTEHVQNLVRLAEPGPHVFVLVLQPEDFTEQQKLRLQAVLENCGDNSFQHALLLLAPPKKESLASTESCMEAPALKDMIRMCRFRYKSLKKLELVELMTSCDQIVKENNGEHVSCDFSDLFHLPANFDPAQVSAEGFRIVLFGKSEEEKVTLGNFILNKNYFHLGHFGPSYQCESADGEFRGNAVTVVKTLDMFSLSVEAVREEVKHCVGLCPPGPNVLLLLVKPSDFTEKNRLTLKSILSLFGGDAFRHSLVITTHDHKWTETSVSVNKLLQECDRRHYSKFLNNHNLLIEKIQSVSGLRTVSITDRSREGGEASGLREFHLWLPAPDVRPRPPAPRRGLGAPRGFMARPIWELRPRVPGRRRPVCRP